MATKTKADTKLLPAEALKKLKTGNADYVGARTGGKAIDDGDRRKELANKQEPFAVVVSCSDSRVPPERLFGVGCGDIFVIRVAGNTVDTTALGSIQYAVAVLNSPLVVVMGHERCGAVKAATDIVCKNAEFPGVIGKMVEPIVPAALAVRDHKGDMLQNAVKENVRRVVESLKSDPILKDRVPGCLDIVGAWYDLDTGKVAFMKDHEAAVA